MQSMDEIYQMYARTVYKYLLTRTHNSDLAEELTQETFYQAIRSIHRFDGSCQISTWLCAIAKNVWFSYQRKHPPAEQIEEKTDAPELAADSAETKVMESASHVELMKKLHVCPEPFREVLYLRIFGNLSFREIGEIMEKTENWARVTFYRGKEKLRKELVEDEI
ncbi:MAG: sigma-70 family RNA polymerase sigma factor [Lachnospiraceae bacterium]|nr:sigma-70 family RNA polymerase sigma factor [Lachnospiraceae bacterium]